MSLNVLENKTELHEASLVHFLKPHRNKLCVLQFGRKVSGRNLKFHLTLYHMQDQRTVQLLVLHVKYTKIARTK